MDNRRPLSKAKKAALLAQSLLRFGVVGGLLIGLPSLVAWLVMGGAWRWQYIAIGIAVALLLFLGFCVVFGWALGRRLRGRK